MLAGIVVAGTGAGAAAPPKPDERVVSICALLQEKGFKLRPLDEVGEDVMREANEKPTKIQRQTPRSIW